MFKDSKKGFYVEFLSVLDLKLNQLKDAVDSTNTLVGIFIVSFGIINIIIKTDISAWFAGIIPPIVLGGLVIINNYWVNRRIKDFQNDIKYSEEYSIEIKPATKAKVLNLVNQKIDK